MPSYPDAGSALRGWREARGLTQEKLGELSGIHATNIGRIERGESEATLGTLVDLAIALGLEPDYLVKFRIPGGLRLPVIPAGPEPQTLLREHERGPGSASKYRFLVVVQPTRDGYAASAPDLPGCTARGATSQAAESGMLKALNAHLQALRKAGRPIPAALAYAVAMSIDV